MEKVRKKFTFYGSVQGVGFRYRAYYAAINNGVTGWVKNSYDGSVEMEAEGSAESIENMLLEIQKGRFVRIENFECRQIEPEDSKNFEITG